MKWYQAANRARVTAGTWQSLKRAPGRVDGQDNVDQAGMGENVRSQHSTAQWPDSAGSV